MMSECCITGCNITLLYNQLLCVIEIESNVTCLSTLITIDVISILLTYIFVNNGPVLI